jgi:hypothetical protein
LHEEAPTSSEPLQFLLRHVGAYEFVTPTPATHERYLQRNRRAARDLRDVFGWSLPFEPGILPPPLFETLEQGNLLSAAEGGLMRSKVRVSTLGALRFIHSAFPTDDEDSVFFGPDSYRFASFLRSRLPRGGSPRHLVDIGAGSGVGGVVAASLAAPAKVTLLDINPRALRFASANAAHAGVEVDLVHGTSLGDVDGPIDLVIANPPYIMDEAARLYRHGGDMQGARLSLDWAVEAAERLVPGGAMLLYTGAAILGGRDPLREALAAALPPRGCTFTYEELDPDVFGEELEKPRYREVERIAVVGAIIVKQ